MVIVQPYIEQADDDPAAIEDVVAFLEAHGFVHLPADAIAIPEVAAVS